MKNRVRDTYENGFLSLGIAIAGAAFGLVGAVLTVPHLATLTKILRYALRKLQGCRPFPEEEEKERQLDSQLWRQECGQRLASRIQRYAQHGDESLAAEGVLQNQKRQAIPKDGE